MRNIHIGQNHWKWSAWSENLEVATYDAPAAASWKMERVDVLVHTADNHMSRRYWEKGKTFEIGQGWKGWENIGGQSKTLKSAPPAVSTGPNRIDCFVHGSSNHLFHAWYQDGKQEEWKEIDTLSIKDAPVRPPAYGIWPGDETRASQSSKPSNNSGWEPGKKWEDSSTIKYSARLPTWHGGMLKRLSNVLTASPRMPTTLSSTPGGNNTPYSITKKEVSRLWTPFQCVA